MNNIQKIAVLMTLALAPAGAMAQNGSNSSYSRFGLGTLAEQSQTYNRAMGGVGLAMRDGGRVNMLNPASYSAIDSLTFLMDVGVNLQYGHLSAPGNSLNVRNTTLSNVNAGFHVARGLGMSFGFVPYSTIGYTFSAVSKVGSDFTSSQDINMTTNYSGSGGIHQLYIGAGWNPFAKLSVGVNASYLWGEYNHSLAQNFYEGGSSNSEYSSQNQIYQAYLRGYKLDFGLQYPVRLSSADWLTIGATYSLGHSLSGNGTMLRYTSVGDSTNYEARKPFQLPHTFGGGLAWRHKNTLLVGADVSYEKWADCKLPMAQSAADGTVSYTAQKGGYLNRTKVAVGAEYTPDPNPKDRRYAKTIRYRLGASYSTPYLVVNGQDGPKEFRTTAGVGLPLRTRKMSGRSTLNISAEWMQRRPSMPGMIKENYMLLNVGVTFNEQWFMKWKIN